MTWREISTEQLNTFKNCLIIDVRSPCEYEAEHIPDAFSVPLLSNEERHVIGCVYAEKGDMAARFEALAYICPKIPEIVQRILELRTKRQHLVVHCWRGGLRSEAVSSFLSVVGIDCYRLTGGYKAWRKQLLKEFEQDNWDCQTIVLHGHTGAGKTDVLKELKVLGYNVLDLEHLANHRGSAFGAFGLGNQPTQKNFDGLLWNAMKELTPGAPVFIEAEGRKIGRLAVPDFLIRRIADGRRVLVTCDMPVRTNRIISQYASELKNEQVLEVCTGLKELKARLGQKGLDSLKELILANRLSEAVEKILSDYYDPMYQTHIEKNGPYDITIDGSAPDQAAIALLSHLSKCEGPLITPDFIRAR